MIKNYVNEIIDKSLKKSNIPKVWLDYIKDPVYTVTVKFPLGRETGIETIIGHRVIHSNHHLPSKGGLRFSNKDNVEILGSLASINSYKSALLDIPFSGAKGSILINPDEYDEMEKTIITRRFTLEMWKRSMISSSTDIMGPERGTNSRTMNIIKDTYKNINNTNNVDIDNIVVGKSVNFGGLEAFYSSHGLGVAAAVNYLTENITNNSQVFKFTGVDMSLHKKSVIIHGFGRTGYNAAKFLHENNEHKDYKIIGITEGEYGIYNPIGFKPQQVKNYLDENQSLQYFSNNTLTAEEVLTRKCDVVILTTNEFSVDKDLADNFDCKFLFEGHNIPLTGQAQESALRKNIIIVPDLLSSCGSQVCSYIEWLKNLEHRNLTMLFRRFESRVRSQFIKLLIIDGEGSNKVNKYEGPTENDLVINCIEDMVFNSFSTVLNEANKENIDLRSACYKVAIERIYKYYDQKKLI